MALHYQLEDIKVDYKSEDIWPTTQTLIFATMNVGLSSITEENWKEFYTRCKIAERIFGVWRYNDKNEECPIKPEEVKDHIGLITNASKYTNEEFMKATDKKLREEARYLLKKLED